ncbi:MAG: cell division protein FtsZ [Rhodospirillaceae bacterium]|nr:cell division protein FtsZ [Rhodospirillaceae bacterium]|tara:strand:- start:13462 stop:15213 length:1752 start_codon:yes stop_codon:yes gene_type:complete
MTIQLGLPETQCLKPRITVIGVGGAGGNAVNNMILSGLQGVDFVVANTDAQAIDQSQAERRIQLGVSITQGLGAGSRPDIGKAAAEEAMEEIMEQLIGSHMVFITAGMGGGTGTGATPVVARAAREQGMLTVGVVTKPFHFEGQQRMRLAEEGMAELQQYVDTLIIIPNQNLFRVANDKTTFADAFKMADDVLHAGVRGVTDLMVQPGLINLDFADVRTVMSEMGKAMMGTGEAEGERRALEAAEAAIANPLLDEVSMKGARGVLINITGGSDMTLFEVDEAANRIRDEVDSDANIIFGAAFDESMAGGMRVSLVATGIEAEGMAANTPGRPALTAIEGGQSVRAPAPAPTPIMTRAGQHALALDTSSQPQAELQEPEVVQDVAPEPVVANPQPAPEQPGKAFAFLGRTAPEPETALAAETVTEPARTDAFIAPSAVEAPKKPASAPAAPSAFGSAALVNNSNKEARKPSLFERMTGAGRSHKEPARQEPAIRPKAAEAPAAPEPKPEPVAEAPAPAPVSEPAAAEPAPAPVAAPEPQPEPEAKPEPVMAAEPAPAPQTATMEVSTVEDDVLDIPAFLRRHKN